MIGDKYFMEIPRMKEQPKWDSLPDGATFRFLTNDVYEENISRGHGAHLPCLESIYIKMSDGDGEPWMALLCAGQGDHNKPFAEVYYWGHEYKWIEYSVETVAVKMLIEEIEPYES